MLAAASQRLPQQPLAGERNNVARDPSRRDRKNKITEEQGKQGTVLRLRHVTVIASFPTHAARGDRSGQRG
jgi:hypothetical protein